MHVAIVHDWLNGMRGGEKVLEELLDLFPEAVIYTLFHERGKVSPRIESHRIETSWLNRLPGVYRYYRNLLPLFPSAIESFDLSGFDLVISSSHAVAKGVRAPGAKHICYCHTPMRYVWDAEDDYAMAALEAGAIGYLPKDSAPEEILAAIRRASSGERYISPTLAEKLLNGTVRQARKLPHESLSNREFDVMRMLGKGIPLIQIAERLHLSPKTVSTYRTRVLEKMELDNNSDITRYVLTNKLGQ